MYLNNLGLWHTNSMKLKREVIFKSIIACTKNEKTNKMNKAQH